MRMTKSAREQRKVATGLLFYSRMLYFAQRRSGVMPVLGAEE